MPGHPNRHLVLYHILPAFHEKNADSQNSDAPVTFMPLGQRPNLVCPIEPLPPLFLCRREPSGDEAF
jgi:hypothetical protein